MLQDTLEARVTRLEQLVENIRHERSRYPAAGQDWRRTIGMFRGDPIMKEICDEALRLREQERQQFRQQQDVEPK
jgi:hypothetical protein